MTVITSDEFNQTRQKLLDNITKIIRNKSENTEISGIQYHGIMDSVDADKAVHNLFVSYIVNGLHINRQLIPIIPEDYTIITEASSTLNKTALVGHKNLVQGGKVENPDVKNLKGPGFLSSITKLLKKGNTHLNIERNQINACIGIAGFVILIVTIMLATGLSAGAIAGIGAAIVLSAIIIIAVLVAAKKISPAQAIVYGLLIILMLGLAVSPVGATALLAFKIIYGAALIAQGAVFNITRAVLGLGIDDRKNHQIARGLGDKPLPISSSILGNLFLTTRGLGYVVLGVLTIVSISLSIALPGWQALDETVKWLSRSIYYFMNPLTWAPRIVTTIMDKISLTKYQDQLKTLYGEGTPEECTKTLRWLQQNLIHLDFSPIASRTSLEMLMNHIHTATKQSDAPLATYEELEKIITDNNFDNARTFIQRLMETNQRKIDFAKIQLRIYILYEIINPILFLLGDLITIIPGFQNWLTEKVFNLHPQTSIVVNQVASEAITNASAIGDSWQSLLSTLRSLFAAKIYIETRDRIDNPPTVDNVNVKPQKDTKDPTEPCHEFWLLFWRLIHEKIIEGRKNKKLY